MKWIKCSEKMPRSGKRVLVASNVDWAIAHYFKNEDGDIDWRVEGADFTPYMSTIITHWQPLPELPKDKE